MPDKRRLTYQCISGNMRLPSIIASTIASGIIVLGLFLFAVHRKPKLDLDLCEAAFRSEFADRYATFHNTARLTNEVVFISLGRRPTNRRTWRDPPAGFVNRFKDIPWVVGCASEARLPQRGEMVSKMKCRSVEQRGTGRSAVIYFVNVTTQTTTNAILETGMYGGGLYGGGCELRATKHNGRWKFEMTGRRMWMSANAQHPAQYANSQ